MILPVPYPFKGASGEEGQHQSKRGHKQPWEAVDDTTLLKNDRRGVEGRQECNVAVAYLDGVFHKQIWKSIGKLPEG